MSKVTIKFLRFTVWLWTSNTRLRYVKYEIGRTHVCEFNRTWCKMPLMKNTLGLRPRSQVHTYAPYLSSFLLLDSDSDDCSSDDFDEPQKLRTGRPCAAYNSHMYISAASGSCRMAAAEPGSRYVRLSKMKNNLKREHREKEKRA